MVDCSARVVAHWGGGAFGDRVFAGTAAGRGLIKADGAVSGGGVSGDSAGRGATAAGGVFVFAAFVFGDDFCDRCRVSAGVEKGVDSAGGGAVVSGRGESGAADAVDAICRSSAYCSLKNQIGAAGAIERDVGLGGLVENGTVMNAVLTPELLNTIFWPGSMLGDMRGGGAEREAGRRREVQPGLSESGDVAGAGARHRAAAGVVAGDRCGWW